MCCVFSFFFVFSFCKGGPSDPDAFPQTIQYFNRLLALQETGIMYGHEDTFFYGYEWEYLENYSDIKALTGDFPAVAGFELGHIELGHEKSLDNVPFSRIRDEIIKFHGLNGVITVNWHLDNPLNNETAWSVSSNKVVHSILPNGTHHQVFLDRLELLTKFLLSLQDESGLPIPFIFRPFHEHSGDWFWWGKPLCTNQEYVSLFQFTVSYLRGRGLHNILFAYNTDLVTSYDEYFEGFPGDDYVDIYSIDMYDHGNSYFKDLDYGLALVSFAASARNKLAALAECGGDYFDRTWFSNSLLKTVKKYKLLYLLNWRNEYGGTVLGPAPNLRWAEDFLNFAKDPWVLLLNDIQKIDVRSYEILTNLSR